MIASSFSQTPLHQLLGKKWYQMMPIIQEGIMKRTIDEAHNR